MQTINKKLENLGYSQKMIAESLGRSSSLISKVISGKAKSYTVSLFISKILKEDINALFPDVGVSKKLTKSQYHARLLELKELL